MEVRVYKSMSEYSANKPLYCARVNVPSCFPFEKALEVFGAIYGTDVIIVFLCV